MSPQPKFQIGDTVYFQCTIALEVCSGLLVRFVNPGTPLLVGMDVLCKSGDVGVVTGYLDSPYPHIATPEFPYCVKNPTTGAMLFTVAEHEIDFDHYTLAKEVAQEIATKRFMVLNPVVYVGILDYGTTQRVEVVLTLNTGDRFVGKSFYIKKATEELPNAVVRRLGCMISKAQRTVGLLPFSPISNIKLARHLYENAIVQVES